MRKKIILVIDDDEMNLQIAKMILERKLPCEVIVVTSGVEGIEVLRSQCVNLVLLDVIMPDFDGMETLREIHDDATISSVPVMMLTASSDAENVKRAAELGVKDYIKKPFMPADLVKRVEKKLAEADKSIEHVLIFGSDADELAAMQSFVEENFPHEVLTAATVDDAEKILREETITLVIACAGMKFIDGFRVMNFMAANENFSDIPFALTTADNLREVLNKLNPPEVEEPPAKVEEPPAKVEEPPAAAPIPDSAPTAEDKRKLAHIVTNFIGYSLDVHV